MIERLSNGKDSPRLEKGDSHKKASDAMSDAGAERELDELLDNPENKFLKEIKVHRTYIDNATPQEALAYVIDKIEARLQRTFRFEHAIL